MAEVSILMCTYNGEKYLKEQLDSFRSQTMSDWELLVSDDGSDDKTLEIIDLFHKENQNNVYLISGPRKGFASNFLNAVKHSSDISPFFAFSDQDDIWNANKLETALSWLKEQDADVPALYCSVTEYVDEEGRSWQPRRLSKCLPWQPTFANALAQSTVGGNTMVFNRAARDLLITWGTDLDIPSHDWWLYIIVLGVGGSVKFDPRPSLKYRQHTANLIGANSGLGALFERGMKFLKGYYRNHNALNIRNLRLMEDQLTVDNINTLKLFEEARTGFVLKRYLALYKSGVRRHGLTGLFFWLGPLLNKI